MTRAHRSVHLWAWLVLTPVLVGVIAAALLVKPTGEAGGVPEDAARVLERLDAADAQVRARNAASETQDAEAE